MSELQDILSQIPIDQVAAELGVDQATAQSAVQHLVPALLNGLQANSADPSGASSLTDALGDHNNDLLAGGVDLSSLDGAEGEQIVQNIFGGNTAAVTDQLGGLPLAGRSGGLGGALAGKLLQILAPIILSYLAKRIFGSGGLGTGGGAAADSPTGGGGGGVVADGSTGGGSMAPGGRVDTGPSSAQAPAQSNGQDAGPGAGGVSITDILGQILGGGAGGSASSGGSGGSAGAGNSAGQIDIGSILGDLLGGGKR